MATEIISTGVSLADPPSLPEPEGALVDDGAAEAETRLCEIPVDMHGWRIDKALARLIPEFSRSYLQQLMADGAVQLWGVLAQKASARIVAGDRLQVELRPTLQAQAFVAQPMALDVVHEDADLLVINKPAGLVVHPAAGNWSGTLLNGLLAHHKGASELPRAGIVHRLDKDTSGLMLVAKSRQAMEALVRAIAEREVHRQYLALAHGSWDGAKELTVDQPIGRDTFNRLRMAVLRADATHGKVAQTAVKWLDGSSQVSLLACKLHTGRTHQIRVHMAWLGHPLVGDALYGGRMMWGMQRQALHATRLRLRHPTQDRLLEFKVDPPADFLDALAQSALRYNESSLG